MNKILIALILLFFSTIAISADEENILNKTEGSARSWLELIDKGKYKESWRASSTLFKEKISESEWIKYIIGIRIPLGLVNARYLAAAGSKKTLPGFPVGNYVILQFYTTFTVKELVLETLSLVEFPNGIWKVVEYTIE